MSQRAWWEAIPEDVRGVLVRHLLYASPPDRSEFPDTIARVVVPWAGWRYRDGAADVLRNTAERLDTYVRYLAEEREEGGRYGPLYSRAEKAVLIALDHYEYAYDVVSRARFANDVEVESVRAMWKAFEQDIELSPRAWRERIRVYVSSMSRNGPKADQLDPERDVLVSDGRESVVADSDTNDLPVLKRQRSERRWFREVQPIGPPLHSRLERAVSALCDDMENTQWGSRDRREALADAAYILLTDSERANDEGLRGLHGFDYGWHEWVRELAVFIQPHLHLRAAWRHACSLRGANPRAQEVLQPHPITALELRAVFDDYQERLLEMVDLQTLPAALALIAYDRNKKLVRTALYLAALGRSPDKWAYPVMMTLAEWGFESDDDTERFSTRLRVYMHRVRAEHVWLEGAAADLKRCHLV